MDIKQPEYSIMVFTQLDLGAISPAKLQADLLDSSFHTLSQQYGLDTGQIDQTKQNLEVIFSDAEAAPFFLVKYCSSWGPPIEVYRWRCSSEEGKYILDRAANEIKNENLGVQISGFCAIYDVSLNASQVKDMGLLLGYEIARWIGFYGDGLVRDLHGDWYALNKHQAFIRLSQSG